MLEAYIKDRLKSREILLMTHIVMGYPSFEASMEIIERMVEAGVDLMELQIPFSEPVADGPVILNANQLTIEKGVTVRQCRAFAEQVVERFDIPFLYMTYYNIMFRQGLAPFISDMKRIGIKGSIVPDLPPEEGDAYLDCMNSEGLDPIFIFSPSTPDERMQLLSSKGSGFIYCVARAGVTGKQTDFTGDMEAYLKRCRQATDLPLAVGFGVKNREDIDFLRGKADIAVVGSQTIRLVDEQGPAAVSGYIRSLIDA